MASDIKILTDALEKGWNESLAENFIYKWGEILNRPVSRIEHKEHYTKFRTDLNGSRLRGIRDMPCVLVGGDDPLGKKGIMDYWHSIGAEQNIPCILALSDHTYSMASSILTNSKSVIISRERIEWILAPNLEAEKRLIMEIRNHIPLLQLMPFTITQPVVGPMFFGRKNELEQLKRLVLVEICVE